MEWPDFIDNITKTGFKPTLCKGLPWLKAPPPNVDNKDTDIEFFRLMLIQSQKEEKASYLLHLYDQAKDLFPFYLPQWYYNMDTTSLSLTAKKAMWDHVTHLMLLNNWNGIQAWAVLGCEFYLGEHGLYNPVVCYSPIKVKEFDMQEEKMCTYPALFLLEPWILVQLPFKPVILHQWLVAALAETLEFEKLTAEFFNLHFPVEFKPIVMKLRDLRKTLRQGLDVGFDFLSTANARHSQTEKDKSMCSAIEEMLPVLEFIMSKEASSMINHLKAKLWGGGDGLKTFNTIAEAKVVPTVYDLEFWMCDARYPGLFGKSNVVSYSPKCKCHCFGKASKSPDWLKPICPVEDLYPEMIDFIRDGSYKQHVPITLDTQHPIDPQPLTNPFASNIYKMFKLLAHQRFSDPVWEDESSPIFDILSLGAEVKMAEASCRLLQIYSTATKTPLRTTVAKGNEFTEEEIEAAFSRARDGEDWKFCNILARLTELTPKTQPGYQNEHEFACFLEARIKQVVLKMAKSCLSETPQMLHLMDVSEWDVVQFVLPCLVVSFSEHHQDESIAVERRSWFLKFMDGLIKTYEGDNCFTSTPISKYTDTRKFFNKVSSTPYIDLPKTWEKVKSQVPYPCARAILDNLDNFITLMCEEESGVGNSMEVPWRFIWRVQHVVRSLEAKNDPNDNLRCLALSLIFIAFDSHDCYICNHHSHQAKPTEEFILDCVSNIFNECSKSPQISLHRLRKARPSLPKDLQESFMKEGQHLSKHQLLGIAFYLVVNYPQMATPSGPRAAYPRPFPFDPVLSSYYWYRHGDLWRLKQIISGLMKSGGEDLSTVSFEFASQEAPLCYSIVLHDISRKKKVKMQHPGELTFCPVKHCRWCGLVESENFRTCGICIKEPDYADTHFFCSEGCELKALETYHNEEHARAEMIKCAIIT